MSATLPHRRYASFSDFYPAYLSEHSHRANRQLHFLGSTLALLSLLLLLVTHQWWWIAVAVFCGYGFAWVGHFMVERNQPATFRHPLYSFMGDWVMYWQMLTGQVSF
ncbi:Mpo1-like protein [Herbaspirillum sp. NPDC087042]|uniref:Mpo1-like protein n=1 Tax=Herbaspirillum sp. NPDC087042 TaxID=3364004 RepID=UPI003811EA78